MISSDSHRTHLRADIRPNSRQKPSHGQPHPPRPPTRTETGKPNTTGPRPANHTVTATRSPHDSNQFQAPAPWTAVSTPPRRHRPVLTLAHLRGHLVKRHPQQEGAPVPLPQSELRHRQSATCLVEASVQYWLMASGPALRDVLACSDSWRKLGAGACRHRPEERPTIRRLAAGRPAIPGTVQECPVDEACAETLPLYFRGERDFRNDAPLALMTDLPHEPRIGYPVTAVDANILETSRPRRGVQQEEPLGPRTAKKHPPPTKLIQPVRCPHRISLASPLPNPSLAGVPAVVLQTTGTATPTLSAGRTGNGRSRSQPARTTRSGEAIGTARSSRAIESVRCSQRQAACQPGRCRSFQPKR